MPEEPFVFSSPRGYALCRRILKEHVMILMMCRLRIFVKSWIILIYWPFLQLGLVKQVSYLCTCWLYMQSKRRPPCVLLSSSWTIHVHDVFWLSVHKIFGTSNGGCIQ